MNIAVGALILSLAPAASPPANVAAAWSTYLRAGPASTAAALDEVEHDAHVQVLACYGRWCRVSTAVGEGFLDRDALTLPRVPRPDASAHDCVTALQADARAPTPTRFCSAMPPSPPAR